MIMKILIFYVKWSRIILIESLMDEVTVYKESGVTISMIKYIKRAGAK